MQAERRAKKNLFFLGSAEAQPNLGGASVSASREKSQEKLVFLGSAEAQPNLGGASVSASREKSQEKLVFFGLGRGAAKTYRLSRARITHFMTRFFCKLFTKAYKPLIVNYS